MSEWHTLAADRLVHKCGPVTAKISIVKTRMCPMYITYTVFYRTKPALW